MSIWAFWACFVSSMRMGRAWELISLSLGLPFGYCRTVTPVMVPPLRDSWTCTGPHWVDATAPVTVVVADDLDEPEDPEESDDPEEPEDPVLTLEVLDSGGLVDAEAIVAEVEVWYPNRSTTADRLLRN